jgi:membrane protease subunit (stomatin/prohibitin family)
MSIIDFAKKQFINVIQYTEDDETTLSWRYPMDDFEIQNGAILVVRESQLAIFVNEGVVADTFGPGTYKLTTQTLPVLTNLKNWDKLFDSPFKSDVYFFNTRLKLDRKWGTSSPVVIRDREFGMVRVRAYGAYSYHLSDSSLFHKKIAGTLPLYSSEQLEGQLRNIIVTHISDTLAESGMSFVDMAGNQKKFGDVLSSKVSLLFEGYGIKLDNFLLQSISLPEELQEKFDNKIAVNMMGGMQAYTQFQTAEAIPLAAQNEGGLASLAAGLGVGFNVGNQIAETLKSSTTTAENNKQPLTVNSDEILDLLEKLHSLSEKGVISKDEFNTKKADLLKKLI